MAYCITHSLKGVAWAGESLGCVMATCPPPDEFDRDGWEWTLNLPVPSPEELAQMDAAAEELRNDFIGELS